MSTRALCALVAAIVVLAARGARADDATQSFDSPLPLIGGATINVSAEKKSVSVAVQEQRVSGFLGLINTFQLGLSGTADNGSAQLFTSADGFAPDLKAKVGLGYSSFLRSGTGMSKPRVDAFMTRARVMELLYAVEDSIPPPYRALPRKSAVLSRDAVVDTVKAELETWERSKLPPSTALGKDIWAVLEIARQLLLTPDDFRRRDALGKQLNDAKIDWAIKSWNDTDGLSQNLLEERYPALYRESFGSIPTRNYYRTYINWTPSVVSLDYRPVVSGTPDLADEQTWKRTLQQAELDVALNHGAWIAGVGVACGQALDEKKSKVHTITTTLTQGVYSAEDRKDAAFGKPDPSVATKVTLLLGRDPLVGPGVESAFQIGGQILGGFESGVGGTRKYSVSVPFYVQRMSEPMNLVVGLRPTYRWLRGDSHEDQLGVALFVGPRPTN